MIDKAELIVLQELRRKAKERMGDDYDAWTKAMQAVAGAWDDETHQKARAVMDSAWVAFVATRDALYAYDNALAWEDSYSKSKSNYDSARVELLELVARKKEQKNENRN